VHYRVDIYIGSDNHSREINEEYLGKVKEWADENFPDSYTILRGEGCYNGIYEDSVLLNALTPLDTPLLTGLKALKEKLEQEAIIFVKSGVEMEII